MRRDCRRRAPPATASCTAGPHHARPAASTTTCSPSSGRSCRSRRCTCRPRSPGIDAIRAPVRTSRRWRASTPPSTASMPEVAQRLPLPTALWDRGRAAVRLPRPVVRVRQSPRSTRAPGRVVIAHLRQRGEHGCGPRRRARSTRRWASPPRRLGHGHPEPATSTRASPVPTREQGYDADRLEQLVEPGGWAPRAVRRHVGHANAARAAGRDGRAALAVDAFCYQARKHVGALATVLGGLDTLVFAGGIGEKAARIRASTFDGLETWASSSTPPANATDAAVIHTPRRRMCWCRLERPDRGPRDHPTTQRAGGGRRDQLAATASCSR